MNTATRRDRLLNLLHRGTTTVPAITQTLGVSERTVYRDIAFLRGAGHDIQATPGPGGGVRIAPDSRPRAVHFEVSEIIGLALSVAILKAMPHVPFAGSAEAALDRACRALSPERQRAMQHLQQRILIGAPANEHVMSSLGAVDDSLLSVFEHCFTNARLMNFEYVDRCGVRSSRRVECIALALHTPAWYIVAWDMDKNASRVFRMDRISTSSSGEKLEEQHTLQEILMQLSPEDEAESIRRGWVRTPIG